MSILDDEPYNIKNYILKVRLEYGDMDLYERYIIKRLQLEDTMSRDDYYLFKQYNELGDMLMEDLVKAIRKDILNELGIENK